MAQTTAARAEAPLRPAASHQLSSRRRLSGAAFYSSSSALAVLFLAPLVWSLVSSFLGPRASTTGGSVGIANYERLVDYGEGIARYLVNSTIVSAITVLGTLGVSILAGYALARFEFPGKNVLFLATLAILMIPHPTILVPLYTLLRTVGLQNSLLGVGLVLVMFQLPFGLFMMRNAFEGVPRELEEAAMIDGLSTFGALRRVLLRAVLPAIITVGMFAFLASWNEFLAPLIFLSDSSRFTLPIALVAFRSANFDSVDYGALQAGIVISAIPCMLIFTLLQRHYVRGFASGAIRG